MAVSLEFIPEGSVLYVLVSALALALILIFYYLLFSPDSLSKIPRIRDVGKTHFSIWTRLDYLTGCKQLYLEAYKKYSKHGLVCAVPGFGQLEEVIIPSSSLRWFSAQPDHVVGAYEFVADLDQAEWTFGDVKYILNGWGGNLVRTQMGRVLEVLAAAINDELDYAFDMWIGGSQDEWTEVEIMKSMKCIVAQASSRFTLGTSLCRDKEYLRITIKWLDWFVPTAAIIGLVPRFMRSLLAPIIAFPLRCLTWKVEKAFKPVFDSRMAMLEDPRINSTNEPQDNLQMMFRHAEKHERDEMNLQDMTRRLIIANFGSYHQTGIGLTNTVLNILASDTEYNTISIIREEISSITKQLGEKTWSKAGVAKMIQLDSILRETLRLHSFGNRSLLRKVLVDDFKFEDGTPIPKGSNVSILSYSAQTDEDVYENPFKFDPFRFSRIRQRENTSTSASDSTATTTEPSKGSNITFVSTGPQFLPFGHGRHACPGRFLVEFELKMIIAFLVMNYDIAFPDEYQGRRPETKWVAEASIPDSSAKMRVRKRNVVVVG